MEQPRLPEGLPHRCRGRPRGRQLRLCEIDGVGRAEERAEQAKDLVGGHAEELARGGSAVRALSGWQGGGGGGGKEARARG